MTEVENLISQIFDKDELVSCKSIASTLNKNFIDSKNFLIRIIKEIGTKGLDDQVYGFICSLKKDPTNSFLKCYYDNFLLKDVPKEKYKNIISLSKSKNINSIVYYNSQVKETHKFYEKFFDRQICTVNKENEGNTFESVQNFPGNSDQNHTIIPEKTEVSKSHVLGKTETSKKETLKKETKKVSQKIAFSEPKKEKSVKKNVSKTPEVCDDKSHVASSSIGSESLVSKIDCHTEPKIKTLKNSKGRKLTTKKVEECSDEEPLPKKNKKEDSTPVFNKKRVLKEYHYTNDQGYLVTEKKYEYVEEPVETVKKVPPSQTSAPSQPSQKQFSQNSLNSYFKKN